MEDLDTFLDKVAHDKVVAFEDISNFLLVDSAEALFLALTEFLVILERHLVVACEQCLVGLHELLKCWLAIHI